MPFDVFIHVSALVMAEIAWWVRSMLLVACGAGLVLGAIGAFALYLTRAEGHDRAAAAYRDLISHRAST